MDLMELFGRKKDPISLAIEEALVHMGERHFDQALKVLEERALRFDPAHRRALLHVGICRMLMGELDEAERVLIPLAKARGMDSEKATAEIALDKVARLRLGKE